MMRLSALWGVDSTIRPDGSSPVADQILERWEHDAGSARFFRSSANFLYRCSRQERACFLRFTDSGERSRHSIEDEMRLLRWLASAGVRVPVPVPSRSGRDVETVLTDRGTFHAVVFPALHGQQLDIDGLDEPGFERWGAALGHLHATMKDYPGAPRHPAGSEPEQMEAARSLLPDDGLLRQELDAIASSLRALPMDSEVYGLIHSDFELDNILWQEDGMGILDFDNRLLSWYAADIAWALRDLFREGADLDHSSFLAFVRGYRLHRPVDDTMLVQVPTFLRLADALLHGRLVRAVDLPAGEHYPEWLTALDQRLRRYLAAFRRTLEQRHNQSP